MRRLPSAAHSCPARERERERERPVADDMRAIHSGRARQRSTPNSAVIRGLVPGLSGLNCINGQDNPWQQRFSEFLDLLDTKVTLASSRSKPRPLCGAEPGSSPASVLRKWLKRGFFHQVKIPDNPCAPCWKHASGMTGTRISGTTNKGRCLRLNRTAVALCPGPIAQQMVAMKKDNLCCDSLQILGF